MWYTNRFFKYTVGIILVLLIILLTYHIAFLINPFIDFFAALFFPVLFASILYYVLRPLVNLIEKTTRLPRWISILITYVIVTVGLVTLISYVGPILAEQVNLLSSSVKPEGIQEVKEKTVSIMRYFNIQNYSTKEINELITSTLQKFYEFVSSNIVSTLASITRFAMWLIITPFILYYLLKDDNSLHSVLRVFVPKKYQLKVREIIEEIDYALSMFISGQLLVALSLGFLLFIGYLIIGLNNAFILALFATLCITIPIFGSFIALIPALLVGLSMEPWMAVKVLLVMAVAQILESNFISPQIMGKRLNIHPLILMLILLASGSLYGILGLFLATPVYAILRVLFNHFYEYYYPEETISS